MTGLPRIRSAHETAHLLLNENPYGPAPSAIRAMADLADRGCYYRALVMWWASGGGGGALGGEAVGQRGAISRWLRA